MTKPPDYRSFSALVVDDMAFVRQLVGRQLQQIGFGKVVEAADGDSALTAVRDHRPQITVCDIEMEPKDGLDFLKELRALPDPALARTPVVFLTRSADSLTVQVAKSLGVNAFIVKPPTIGALTEKIAAVLAAKGPAA